MAGQDWPQWGAQVATTLVVAAFTGMAAGRREAKIVRELMDDRLNRIEKKLDDLLRLLAEKALR